MSSVRETIPLAITMGEPAGIGPDLIANLWVDRKKNNLPPFVYFGAPEALKASKPDIPLEVIDSVSDAVSIFDKAVPVCAVEITETVIPGQLSTANGVSVIKSIDYAVNAALKGVVSGVVTAPIHKAVLYKAGFDAPGHTEYLARLCGLDDTHSIMMLTAQNLRVVPVTIHMALGDVTKYLTTEKIIHAGMATARDLKVRFGIDDPKLAMAALNPHAGEDGTMGMEEATHIRPAVWALRDAGIHVTDPLPADTLFHEEAREKYDAVLCMYHDQALIPVKTLDFWGGVNVTLGLPIIRTSPDHGTALDLAGKGLARPESMLAAIKLATEMASHTAKKND